MSLFLEAICFMLALHSVTAQSNFSDSTTSDFAFIASLTSKFASIASLTSDIAFTASTTSEIALVDSTTSDIGILQLVTPTTHASQVPVTALQKLSDDAYSFYTSYTQVDSFDFQAALVLFQNTLPASALITAIAGNGRLVEIYYAGQTSLLENPSSYLSRLHASATQHQVPFSSSLLSQATGLLRGYQSIVSQDVLGVRPTQGPITPGMSIDVGAAVTGGSASPSGTVGVAQASQTTGSTLPAGSTSPSNGAGMAAAGSNPQMIITAAAAAMILLGAAAL